MLAIFVAMICGVVVGPLPPAPTTLVAVAIALLTKTVTFAEGLKAFTAHRTSSVLLFALLPLICLRHAAATFRVLPSPPTPQRQSLEEPQSHEH